MLLASFASVVCVLISVAFFVGDDRWVYDRGTLFEIRLMFYSFEFIGGCAVFVYTASLLINISVIEMKYWIQLNF